MNIVSVSEIPGKRLEMLGLVKGSVVQTKHLGKDIVAGFKSIVGGEIKQYSEMLTEARRIATERMVAEAKELGADAIVCVRYETASIMDSAAEVMVYGTAVKISGPK